MSASQADPVPSPHSAGNEPSAPDDQALADIFRALKHGAGRERVTDANVDALIALAGEKGEQQIEFLLREWRSPCGDDPDAPTLPASNPPPRG